MLAKNSAAIYVVYTYTHNPERLTACIMSSNMQLNQFIVNFNHHFHIIMLSYITRYSHSANSWPPIVNTSALIYDDILSRYNFTGFVLSTFVSYKDRWTDTEDKPVAFWRYLAFSFLMLSFPGAKSP